MYIYVYIYLYIQNDKEIKPIFLVIRFSHRKVKPIILAKAVIPAKYLS